MLQSERSNRVRAAHTLKQSKGRRLPQRFIFFDVETEKNESTGAERAKLIVACHWIINNKTGSESIKWFHTTSAPDFYTWLLSCLKNNIATRIMSANIWFDFRTSKLYQYMKRDKWSCVNVFNKGHTLIIKFKLKYWRLEFVNIQNYFNVPVSVIGKSVELEKFEVDFKTVSNKDLLRYCRRDVEIIYAAFRYLYILVKENDLGSIPYTLPALSFNSYTHSFMDHGIHVHTDKEILDMERSAYFGGRCECFFIGRLKEGKYYKVDINSMYPYVMKESFYPVKYVKSGVNISLDVIIKLASQYCFIAECEMDTKKPIYPMRNDDKLIFPTGRFITYLTTPSLLYGIKHGHVKKVIKIACYKKANIFKDFVSYFYNLRLEFRDQNNPAFAYLCKIILNSLYGKFGQKTSTLLYSGFNSAGKDIRRLIVDFKTHKTSIHQVFFGRETITAQGEEEALNSMPAISAHVTDYARIYLWLLIEKAGRENCFYCDTDSLIINETGYLNLASLLNPDELGRLKVEATSRAVNIKGAKNYVFGKEVRIKGIPRKAKLNDDGSYTYPVFPGMVRELYHGITEDYRIETQTKVLTGLYNKGVVTQDGTVLPFNMPIRKPLLDYQVQPDWISWLRKVGGISKKIEKGEAAYFTYKESGIRGLVKSNGQGMSFDYLREKAVNDCLIDSWTTTEDFKSLLKQDVVSRLTS